MQTKWMVGLVVAFALGASLGYWGASMPQETAHDMHGAMQSMTSSLAGKSGEELEKAFLEEMIVHHEGAVEMAKQLLAGTDKKELRDMGTAIIEAQTAEIAQMKAWLSEWFAN